MASSDLPTYYDITVTPKSLGDVSVHYIAGGSSSKPTLVLFSGFPSSTTQFRHFIPLLSHRYHVLAPDLAGFGLTKVGNDFVYSFDNMTAVVAAWLEKLNVKEYACYGFDYGMPVIIRLAALNPKALKAIVTQNGNAYEDGFGRPFWDPINKLWETENGSDAREFLRNNILTLETTKFQYVAGVPEHDLAKIDPMTWNSDYLFNVQGKENQEHQLDYFYDYRTNLKLYPKFHDYLRESKVPLLAVWGKGDPAFIPPGAEAYKRDAHQAEVRLIDAGHFALETKAQEVAEIMLEWFREIGY